MSHDQTQNLVIVLLVTVFVESSILFNLSNKTNYSTAYCNAYHDIRLIPCDCLNPSLSVVTRKCVSHMIYTERYISQTKEGHCVWKSRTL